MKIINRLPYSKKRSTLVVGKEIVVVKSYQIIVWVSLAPANLREWNSATPAFPAILDIGTNHNFVISRGHVVRWGGVQPEFLRPLGLTRLGGERLPRCEADLWLHSNFKGRQENPRDTPPYRLNLNEGIIIRPDEGHGPTHLPLLGLRALTHNKLVTIIDGSRLEVTIRTARRIWWPW